MTIHSMETKSANLRIDLCRVMEITWKYADSLCVRMWSQKDNYPSQGPIWAQARLYSSVSFRQIRGVKLNTAGKMIRIEAALS